jgi:hypothetical protein
MQNEENTENLAYWLSNTSCLLFLLQKSLKAAGSVGLPPRKKQPPTSLFGRMAQVCHFYVHNYLAIAADFFLYLNVKFIIGFFTPTLDVFT